LKPFSIFNYYDKKNHAGDVAVNRSLAGVKGTVIKDINAKNVDYFSNGIIKL
jgi:hypothetical protein